MKGHRPASLRFDPGRWALVAALTMLVTSCAPGGLTFRQDDRVTIVRPRDGASIDLPLFVDWTVEDFEITGPDGEGNESSGYFAVFIDRQPMPPGEDIESLADDDPNCRNRPNCPNQEWLRQRLIFPTRETELKLNALPVPVVDPPGAEKHQVTIVLLDEQSRRLGEAFYSVTVFLER